jgi:DNA-binding transcriptional LysR family regulator
VQTGIRFDDETHAIQAAIAGQGVLLASELLIQYPLAQGLLHIALPGRFPAAITILSPARKSHPPRCATVQTVAY